MTLLATFKHISSKNADYGAAEAYLTFEHDEFTMKPTLDENGRLIPREDYRISSLNCGGEDFAVACMRANLRYEKNQKREDVKSHHYGVTKLDGIVEKVIRMKFAEIAAAPESEILNHQHKKEIELARIKLDQANAHLAEKQKDLSDYKAETLKVIRGQSNLSVELLNALVKETETMIALAQTRIDAAQTEYESLLASAENLRQEYDRLLTWADLFDTCSFEAKKMIVAQFVKAVRVSRDYNIEIDFNVSFEEFQNFSVKNGEPVILQPLRSHTA